MECTVKLQISTGWDPGPDRVKENKKWFVWSLWGGVPDVPLFKQSPVINPWSNTFCSWGELLAALSIRLGIASGIKDTAPTNKNFPQNLSHAKHQVLVKGIAFYRLKCLTSRLCNGAVQDNHVIHFYYSRSAFCWPMGQLHQKQNCLQLREGNFERIKK